MLHLGRTNSIHGELGTVNVPGQEPLREQAYLEPSEGMLERIRARLDANDWNAHADADRDLAIRAA